MATFWADLATGVTNVIGMSGSVVDALFTAEGALAPLLGFVFVGLAVSFVLFGIKLIKSLVWGV